MIKENIVNIKKIVPSQITIVAVAKGRSIEEIKEVIDAGITDIGENKVQEAILKYKKLSTIKWHMLGHLQTNKVKDAVMIFDLIQSVDSLRLAVEINKQAEKIKKVQDILIEVKTSGEATKFGVNPDDAIGFIKEISGLKNINIKGLMTIAPIVNDSQKTRPYFRLLREIQDKINKLLTINYRLSTLSMGMTDDFKIALDEGANMLRLGRAIFSYR